MVYGAFNIFFFFHSCGLELPSFVFVYVCMAGWRFLIQSMLIGGGLDIWAAANDFQQILNLFSNMLAGT